MAWKYLQVPPLRQYPSKGQFCPSRIRVFSIGTEKETKLNTSIKRTRQNGKNWTN